MNTHDIDIELPRLPPTDLSIDINSHSMKAMESVSVWTESQMQAYARAAIEAVLQSQGAGMVEILREAAQIIATINPESAPKNIRWPIVDELEGFASKLDHARRVEGDGE